MEGTFKTSKKYDHLPLEGPRSIRVLELQPADNPSAPVQCRLRVISLDDYPQWHAHYTALSYTWDGQKASHEVDCDGRSLLVTPNCDAAIRHLRSAEEVQILWIDSICIDQTEEATAERNVQVALMGQIYKSAAKVVVWLGESQRSVEDGIQKMMEIASQLEHRNPSSTDRRAIQQELRDYAEALSNEAAQILEDSISPLFECSWWYRMWTIQEMSLSFIDRIFLRCGALEAPWPAILIALDALEMCNYKWGRWKEATSLQKQFVKYLLFQRVPETRLIVDGDSQDYHNDPLMFHILTNTRKKQAGNPKDKVLALYSLCKELDIPLPKPDYSLSVEDIYRNAAVTSINYDQKLWILYHVSSDQRREGLASWVPDWSEPGFESDDARYGLLRDRFHASNSEPHLWSFSEDQRALILRGKIVDTIIYKAEAIPYAAPASLIQAQEGSEEERREWENEMLEIIHDTRFIFKTWIELSNWAPYPTGEPSRNALQRTLVLDNPNQNALATADDAFNEWYENVQLDELDMLAAGLQHMGLDDELSWAPELRNEFLRRMKDEVSEQKISFMALGTNSFNISALIWSALKCFFYTEHGYFGTAPDPLPVSVCPDDKIVIVSGLEMPLVLRPIDGGYQLITHAYVHGMMYGERWPASENELEDIVIL